MTTVDILFQDFCIQLFALNIVAREALLAVGNENTTITSTLHGSEDTAASARAAETNIEIRLERPGSILLIERFRNFQLTIWLSDALVLVSQAKLGKGTTSSKEAGGIGGSPVGQTMIDAVSWQLLGRGSNKNKVTLKPGI